MKSAQTSTRDQGTPQAESANKEASKRTYAIPMPVRLQAAKLAKVPECNVQEFCDNIDLPLRVVSTMDRRIATGVVEPGKALADADMAARILHEKFVNLSDDDRAWVDHLWAKSHHSHFIPNLPQTVKLLSELFSIATGQATPLTGKSGARGPKAGSIRDLPFQEFVRLLLIVTERLCGGQLSLSPHYRAGGLINVINLLRPYLPPGLVPRKLPLGTMQKIKSNLWRRNGYPPLID